MVAFRDPPHCSPTLESTPMPAAAYANPPANTGRVFCVLLPMRFPIALSAEQSAANIQRC